VNILKKIVLRSESCIGCGACVGIDAEHFEFSDEGFSVVKSQENLESVALQDAIDACPVAIISLEEVTATEQDLNNKEVMSHCDDMSAECACEKCVCDHVDEECSCGECHCQEDKKETAE